MNSEVVRSRSYSIDEADVIESDQSDVKFMKVSTPQSVRQPRVGVNTLYRQLSTRKNVLLN